MIADELLFDLDKKTLNISSYENKINANINLEWKKVLQYLSLKKISLFLR